MDDAPIKIVLTTCGGKLAVCSVGDAPGGDMDVYSRRELRSSAQEIQQARALWLQIKRVSGAEPRLEQIFEQFPEIRKFCTPSMMFSTYVRDGGLGDNRFRRRSAGCTRDHGRSYFPRFREAYIQRAGRKRNKPQKDSKPL